MHPAYIQLVAKCSSRSICDARATGCYSDDGCDTTDDTDNLQLCQFLFFQVPVGWDQWVGLVCDRHNYTNLTIYLQLNLIKFQNTQLIQDIMPRWATASFTTTRCQEMVSVFVAIKTFTFFKFFETQTLCIFPFLFLLYYTTQELQRSTLTIMKRITSPTCSEGEKNQKS